MEDNSKTRILVVDDEEDLCEILRFNLESEGYEVDTANSGEEALALDLTNYQLVLLDVMMGGISGFAVARRMQDDGRTRHIPIIFLTAKGSESDKITGFGLGADDYIAKPFSIREVLLRVAAVLRRTSKSHDAPQPTRTLQFKGLEVDLDRKRVTIDGREVPFTKIELGLLCELLEHPGHVLSRHDLIRHIWPTDVLVSDRTVDVNILRVRKKLGPYAKYLTTRLGFGYYFSA